jgi:hypothetical protein
MSFQREAGVILTEQEQASDHEVEAGVMWLQMEKCGSHKKLKGTRNNSRSGPANTLLSTHQMVLAI